MSLLVIVPTRTRPGQCARLIRSFEDTTHDADLLFVTDSDDDSYKDMDWHGFRHGVMDPRGCLTEKLNKTVSLEIGNYDHIMWTGDDHVFETRDWDRLLLRALDEIGGSGWVYPANGRRSDVPETWLCSCDVVAELNWFANPVLGHYYIDNTIADIGKRTSLLRYCPQVVISHRHYQVDKETPRDALYLETEATWGERDLKAFQDWRTSTQAAVEVSRLRRKFNPDVSWVLGKI